MRRLRVLPDQQIPCCRLARLNRVSPELVPAATAATRHPRRDDAQDTRRCAGADETPAGRPPCAVNMASVTADIEAAASGGDIAGAVVALRLVLMLEGVECRPE